MALLYFLAGIEHGRHDERVGEHRARASLDKYSGSSAVTQ